jgi:hypothetical protein
MSSNVPSSSPPPLLVYSWQELRTSIAWSLTYLGNCLKSKVGSAVTGSTDSKYAASTML